MSDYSQLVFFTPKDALTTGDVNKRILGAQVDVELARISVAMATKYDSDDRNAASGLAPLDSAGLLPVANLPLVVPQASSATWTPTWTATGGGSIATLSGSWWYQKLTYTLGAVAYALVHMQPLNSGVVTTGTVSGTVTAINMTNVPAAIRPQDSSVTTVLMLSNNALSEAGVATLDTSGNLILTRAGAAAFTAAAGAGFFGTGPQLMYSFKQNDP